MAKWIRKQATIKRDNITLDTVCNVCSECDFPYIGLDWKANYCPRCGSKMDNAEDFESSSGGAQFVYNTGTINIKL